MDTVGNTTNISGAALQVAVPMCGAVIAAATFDTLSVLILAALVLGVGSGLTWTFRSHQGPLTLEWHRVRARRDPQLYRFYRHAGPWAWRLGAGAIAGLALRLVVNG